MTTHQQPVGQRRSDQSGSQHHHPPAREFARRVWISGSVASLLSTLAVSVFSRRHAGAVAAATNAASQWFWYPRARHVDAPSLRYTVAGYCVHHASSLLWGCAYEALAPRRASPRGRAARAAAVAIGAYVVDYHVVPRRLSPGFEHRIRPAGMLAAYGMFALGLFIAGSSRDRGRNVARRACTRRGRSSPQGSP